MIYGLLIIMIALLVWVNYLGSNALKQMRKSNTGDRRIYKGGE